ncbi:HAMP domain-containing histidine kinase, partial [bacterium]|nr:HAMP domain-containing histidine kinase [bacterium]
RGTGLGLAIVKHITLAHHGSADVESAPGEGACFHLRLPDAENTPSGNTASS